MTPATMVAFGIGQMIERQPSMNRRTILAITGATIMVGYAKADDKDMRLVLSEGSGSQESFAFAEAEAALNCHFLLPDDWMIAPDDTAVDAFDETGVLSSLTRRYFVYDPLNRDRCEIEVYTANIVPDRVGLAGMYGAIFARLWGPDKYGVVTHTPVFGEVLTGGDWLGRPSQSRISVWRRGEWLLILRSRYLITRADEYQPVIAGIVGSLQFDTQIDDPIKAALVADPLEMDEGQIVLMRPEWWRDPGLTYPPRDKGQFRFWVDEADDLRDSGAMLSVTTVPAIPDDQQAPSEAAMLEQAGLSLEFFLTNLLPGKKIKWSHTASYTLGRTKHALFDQTFVYKLEFTEIGQVGIGKVTTVLTRDGRLIVSVVMTRAPYTLDSVSSELHAYWVEDHINKAVTAFLATRSTLQ